MEKNGQLTFSDDPHLNSSNEAYSLIEEGDFPTAIEILDKLLIEKPDYPGLVEAYRTARFWNNRKEQLLSLNQGQETANFLMNQWNEYLNYAKINNIIDSSSYKSIQKYVFFAAAEHYKIAFQKQQTPTNNFDLLLNLGICFLTLGEYQRTIETLEYAKSSYSITSKLLSILGEAYYQTNEIPKSLMLFREAFFLNPSEINLEELNSKPIKEIVAIIKEIKPNCHEIKEWIPVIGHISDIFYVKRHLNKQQFEVLKKDIYSLENSFQSMNEDQLETSNVYPRLINKYLWMHDYFKHQNYDFQNLTEIRSRLIELDKDLFGEYFKNIKE